MGEINKREIEKLVKRNRKLKGKSIEAIVIYPGAKKIEVVYK